MMMALLAQLVVIAGSGALALSLPRHHRDLLDRAPSRHRQIGLRLTGWLLLAAGLGASTASAGVVFGVILWVGMLTVATIGTALLFSCHDQWWRR